MEQTPSLGVRRSSQSIHNTNAYVDEQIEYWLVTSGDRYGSILPSEARERLQRLARCTNNGDTYLQGRYKFFAQNGEVF